jgi:hypothetical protein
MNLAKNNFFAAQNPAGFLWAQANGFYIIMFFQEKSYLQIAGTNCILRKEVYMAKTNKQGHTPVIDPKKAGFPATTGQKSGKDRAVVKPPATKKK